MTKINVLVVDDNRSLVEMIKEYFAENAEGNTVNKSINSIPTELHTHGCDLLEATVAELHEFAEGAEPEAEA